MTASPQRRFPAPHRSHHSCVSEPPPGHQHICLQMANVTKLSFHRLGGTPLNFNWTQSVLQCWTTWGTAGLAETSEARSLIPLSCQSWWRRVRQFRVVTQLTGHLLDLKIERTSSQPSLMRPGVNEFNCDLILALIIEDAVNRLVPSPSTSAESVGHTPSALSD
ncbi:unnamed protein product [Phytophthora fragariaefolia]|uniref:Unnamed protein product n=1 Tax=Phytophthora fragariaefolia TaxID=1490495 RepID=A0A9W6Y093_9STRA|nr:unnamed protein product [Phytophthora fragariaefolia]